MGFSKIEKFFKTFNVFDCPQGLTFLSFQLFENVTYHFIRIYATFQMVHYSKRMFLTMK